MAEQSTSFGLPNSPHSIGPFLRPTLEPEEWTTKTVNTDEKIKIMEEAERVVSAMVIECKAAAAAVENAKNHLTNIQNTKLVRPRFLSSRASSRAFLSRVQQYKGEHLGSGNQLKKDIDSYLQYEATVIKEKTAAELKAAEKAAAKVYARTAAIIAKYKSIIDTFNKTTIRPAPEEGEETEGEETEGEETEVKTVKVPNEGATAPAKSLDLLEWFIQDPTEHKAAEDAAQKALKKASDNDTCKGGKNKNKKSKNKKSKNKKSKNKKSKNKKSKNKKSKNKKSKNKKSKNKNTKKRTRKQKK